MLEPLFKGVRGLIACATISLACIMPGHAEPIRGAGSTFAAPILNQWSLDYEAARADGGDFVSPDWHVDYEIVGSLAGVLRLEQPEMDFAATDSPLPLGDLKARGWVQFPIVTGAIAVAVNLKDVAPGQLRLSGPLLADIFLGKLTTWSDPAIAALNPGLTLPNASIEVLYRADGSGSTLAFTGFLAGTSPEWRDRVGAQQLPQWPKGRGERGTGALTALTTATPNSISYLEYGQVVRAGLPFATLQNAAGGFVRPAPAAFEGAAAALTFDPAGGFSTRSADQPDPAAYPLSLVTYGVIPRDRGAARVQRVVDYFRLGLTQGAAKAEAFGYVPVPAAVVQQIETYWAQSFSGLSN